MDTAARIPFLQDHHAHTKMGPCPRTHHQHHPYHHQRTSCPSAQMYHPLLSRAAHQPHEQSPLPSPSPTPPPDSPPLVPNSPNFGRTAAPSQPSGGPGPGPSRPSGRGRRKEGAGRAGRNRGRGSWTCQGEEGECLEGRRSCRGGGCSRRMRKKGRSRCCWCRERGVVVGIVSPKSEPAPSRRGSRRRRPQGCCRTRRSRKRW
ncbi:hypothetical protein B0J12DRAFT_640796 [Macrophomina phaseolina]|uniref:Uncharacterized protein n=1 Tax=Macrophomina phaseolina TaxID=35725 RepID=A0ABQ8GWU5_9PEZI|nr:hypothetical protein B0J12DRAFT_640796 [Macrophomina phaseolina]